MLRKHKMTVNDLIVKLQQVEDKSRLVVLAEQSKGNDYSLLAVDGLTEAWYFTGRTWCPPFLFEAAPPDKLVPCIILWPIEDIRQLRKSR